MLSKSSHYVKRSSSCLARQMTLQMAHQSPRHAIAKNAPHVAIEPQTTRQRGFTLMELMIVIAIVGILAMVAFPSYQSYVLKSNRQNAQTELMKLKMAQENYRLGNASYGSATQIGVPTSDHFTYTVANVTATTYTLTATAKSAQTSDTGCTVLTLDQSMNRAPAACW